MFNIKYLIKFVNSNSNSTFIEPNPCQKTDSKCITTKKILFNIHKPETLQGSDGELIRSSHYVEFTYVLHIHYIYKENRIHFFLLFP